MAPELPPEEGAGPSQPDGDPLRAGVPPSCEQLRDDLVELALGVLGGRRRAEVLAHADGCAGCARELEEHTRTLDSLLEAAPAVEPPMGFESRLMERLDTERRNPLPTPRPAQLRRRRRRQPRLRVLVAALGAALLAGAGAAVVATTRPRPAGAPSSRPFVAALSEHGAARGEVLLSAGQPAWMTVVLVDGRWSGWVTCQVTTTTGQVLNLGAFEVTSGQGAWTVPVKLAAGQLRSARVVSDSGGVLAEARFG